MEVSRGGQLCALSSERAEKGTLQVGLVWGEGGGNSMRGPGEKASYEG